MKARPRPQDANGIGEYYQNSPLQQLQNQTRSLTAELQSLLDAQSAGLLSARTGTPAVTAVETGTGEPAAQLLPSSRSGILSAMGELAEVKAREADLYAQLAHERRGQLATVAAQARKTARLRQELDRITTTSADAVRACQLRAETAALTDEIVAVRRRLGALEARHGAVAHELVMLENVLDARASSYLASLDAVCQKTAAFLREQRQLHPHHPQQRQAEPDGWDTDKAVEEWTAQADVYAQKHAEAAAEGDALRQGMELWQGAMRRVHAFETSLRERIEAAGARAGAGGMDGVAAEIAQVAAALEGMVATARAKGWNLLVVAIGAELQAFREAAEVLKAAASDTDAQLPLEGGGEADVKGGRMGRGRGRGRGEGGEGGGGEGVGDVGRSMFLGEELSGRLSNVHLGPPP